MIRASIVLKNRKLYNFSFYIFWIILIFVKGLGLTSQDAIYRNIVFCIIPFALIKICGTQFSKKELTICIFLYSLGTLIWLSSKNVAILLTVISITSLKNIDLYKLLKLSFWIRASMFLIRFVLATQGYIEIQQYYRYESNAIQKIRYALGYGHPNTAHYMLFVVFTLFILVFYDKSKLYHYVIMMICNIYVYLYTNSRTGLVLCSLLIVLSFLVKHNKIITKITSAISKKFYIFASSISLIICYLFARVPYLRSLSTLSSRFLTASIVMENKELNLFGAPNIVTDFGYINILYENGLILFVIFIFVNTKMIKHFIEKKKYNMVIVFLCYGIYTLSEAYSVSILMNISLVFMSELLFRERKSK